MSRMIWWDTMGYNKKVALCENYQSLIYGELYPEFLSWKEINILYQEEMENITRIRKLKELTKKCKSLLPKIKPIREDMNDDWYWICDYEYRGMTYKDSYKNRCKSHSKLMKKHNKLLEQYSLLNQERRSFRILIRQKQLDLFL